jgi:hypothetical protein
MRQNTFALILALASVTTTPLESSAAIVQGTTRLSTISPVVSVQYWRGGPHNWRGRPYWYARPWVRRPYYGRVVAGVALGTLITVAVVGAVPHRPAPDLCWYWSDPYRNRGYWDYC